MEPDARCFGKPKNDVPLVQDVPAHLRAPPLQEVLRPPASAPTRQERESRRSRAARSFALTVGAAWAVVLWSVLMHLGRVPWLEATLWSLGSAAVFARGVQEAARRFLGRWLGTIVLELGPTDVAGFRERLPRVLSRYGYHVHRADVHAHVFLPRRASELLAPVEVHWAGAGARIRGPRRVVRRLAIEATRC